MLKDEDIGGGRIARGFTRNGKILAAGTPLTADEIMAIPTANRRALIDSNFIEVYPKASGGERFMVGIGDNKFNVIEGRVMNEEPLARKEAEKLLNQS
jgi:hypothetical protein